MGNPFVHLDLATTDLAAAKQFYSQVFDWKLEDMPQMAYVGINVGEGVGGGMGKVQSPDQPPSWTAYVDVADVRETMRKAEMAGARVLIDYMPVGDMGWLGVFMDPQGATIGIWQTARPPAPPKQAAPGRGNGAAKKSAAPAKKSAAPAKQAAPAKKAAAPAKKAAAPARKGSAAKAAPAKKTAGKKPGRR